MLLFGGITINKNDIGRHINMLSRQIKRKIDEDVSNYNVTSVQCNFIVFIAEKSKKQKIYAKDIESRFNMRRATIAGILSLMEKNGLIKRNSIDSDGRLKEITLTNKSLEIKSNIDEKIRKVERNLRKGLTEEELKNFEKVLKKMSKNI